MSYKDNQTRNLLWKQEGKRIKCLSCKNDTLIRTIRLELSLPVNHLIIVPMIEQDCCHRSGGLKHQWPSGFLPEMLFNQANVKHFGWGSGFRSTTTDLLSTSKLYYVDNESLSLSLCAGYLFLPHHPQPAKTAAAAAAADHGSYGFCFVYKSSS